MTSRTILTMANGKARKRKRRRNESAEIIDAFAAIAVAAIRDLQKASRRLVREGARQ